MKNAICGLVAVCLAFSLAGSAAGMMVKIEDEELVSASDLIIVGTVQKTKRVPGTPIRTGGEAILRVDKVLKGPEMKTVTTRYPVPPPKLPQGMAMADHGGMSLKMGQKNLFFLTRFGTIYLLGAGEQGRLPATDVNKFVRLIAAPQVAVTLVEPVGPFYFGLPGTLTMKVKNPLAVPIDIYVPSVTVMFYSEKLAFYNSLIVQHDPEARRAGIRIEAGKELDIELNVTGGAVPKAWEAYSPDTYFQTLVAIRARPFIQIEQEPRRGYRAASNWLDTHFGFPPPGTVVGMKLVEDPSPAERFADMVVSILTVKTELPDNTRNILVKAHPVLLKVTDSPNLPDRFWSYVRTGQPLTEIPWDEARKLVLGGKVTFCGQTHAGHVSLQTRDGKRFSTTEPKIDAVIKRAREVDPKGVFIGIVTE